VHAFVLAVSREHNGTTDLKNGSVIPRANLHIAIENAKLVKDSLNQLNLTEVR
jgi:hypothetical protein